MMRGLCQKSNVASLIILIFFNRKKYIRGLVGDFQKKLVDGTIEKFGKLDILVNKT